ncbi:DUF456 family protein [Tsukamurella soli]|uniref:Uncharacterized protein n=1 Tax=Tsukamurella soli TaxID=644556 RepID=A0ABP8JEM7_9ACTN
MILVGLTGIVIPVLPGSILVAAAVLVWAFVAGGAAWWVFAVVAAAIVAATVVKCLVAGRTMTAAGIAIIIELATR